MLQRAVKYIYLHELVRLVLGNLQKSEKEHDQTSKMLLC